MFAFKMAEKIVVVDRLSDGLSGEEQSVSHNVARREIEAEEFLGFIFAFEMPKAGDAQKVIGEDDEIYFAEIGPEGLLGIFASKARVGLNFLGVSPIYNSDNFH